MNTFRTGLIARPRQAWKTNPIPESRPIMARLRFADVQPLWKAFHLREHAKKSGRAIFKLEKPKAATYLFPRLIIERSGHVDRSGLVLDRERTPVVAFGDFITYFGCCWVEKDWRVEGWRKMPKEWKVRFWWKRRKKLISRTNFEMLTKKYIELCCWRLIVRLVTWLNYLKILQWRIAKWRWW